MNRIVSSLERTYCKCSLGVDIEQLMIDLSAPTFQHKNNTSSSVPKVSLQENHSQIAAG